nr:ribonuclease H-like domain-containing protein [Tanacetum cinerariifolium]
SLSKEYLRCRATGVDGNSATNLGLGSIPPSFGPQQGNITFGDSVTNQGNTTLSLQQQALLTHMVYGSGNQSTPHGQETFLPQAFNTMTLQEPNANWNMDTGSDELRTLVSRNFISCNKTKPSVLCHACHLGKHVRLPFSLYETIVTSPFDIIHSDLWTSPLSSITGTK